RPYPGDTAPQKARHRGQSAGADALAPGHPDDEAREQEEEVHRQIALGEQVHLRIGQAQCEADMEEHDEPGRDAADAGQRHELPPGSFPPGLLTRHASAGLALRSGRQLASSRLRAIRSEEHTSELQSRRDLVCRLLLEKKKDRSRSQSPLLLCTRDFEPKLYSRATS